MDLDGKVAIITGGAGGIGLSIAKILLENGVSVALLDRDKANGMETKLQLQKKHGEKKVEFFSCDVTNKDEFHGAVKEAKEKFSGLDIFVNNAGILSGSPRWERVLEVNLIGLMRGAEEAMSYMSKESGGRGGVVVNIASILGLMAYPEEPPYAASKHGVIGFTRSLGSPEAYNVSGVRHIAVCPGYTDTPLAPEADDVTVIALQKRMNTVLIKQKPENVAACVLKVIKSAPSGSIWVAEDEEPGYEIDIPFYKTLRKTSE